MGSKRFSFWRSYFCLLTWNDPSIFERASLLDSPLSLRLCFPPVFRGLERESHLQFQSPKNQLN